MIPFHSQFFLFCLQITMIQLLLDKTEVALKEDRLGAMRGLLYIAQGCWLECQCDSECFKNSTANVELLYSQGVFATFVELLNLEME